MTRTAQSPVRRETARLGALVALCCLAVLALAAIQPASAAVATNHTANQTAAPPDPAEDRLGWENGMWYNESLDVTNANLSQSEIDRVAARTMARVERIRGIEFDRVPPVRLISPDQQANETAKQFEGVNETERIALNVQYESLLLINESTNAVRSQQALFGGGVSGYYEPGNRTITMVSPTAPVLRMQENVLSQELFHAQQYNQFDLNGSTETTDARNGKLGVVEGDANYVQSLYEQRCETEWDCLLPDSGQQESTSQPANLSIGMVQLFLQPYNSGLAFVRERHQSEGWDAVDALYDRLPASSEQTIHPEKYPDDEPANVSVPDRSNENWAPLQRDGERVTGSVGEAGLFVSLWMPGFESQRRTTIIPYRTHLNIDRETGQISRPVSYAYDHRFTAGWEDDRLVPYVATDGNETGYVYETAWESQRDATEFYSAYRQLLEYHGATPVKGQPNTLRIPEGNGFADAFSVVEHDSRVTIVNAPTVDALSAIRSRADMANTSDANATTANGDSPNETATTEGPTTTNGTGPGLGAVSAFVGILFSVALLARTQS